MNERAWQGQQSEERPLSPQELLDAYDDEFDGDEYDAGTYPAEEYVPADAT